MAERTGYASPAGGAAGDGPRYDVCLLLEGTYPFVAGGVSTWVHDLVSSLPDLTFTAVCLLASSKEKHQVRYALPPNFVDHRVLYLHDYDLAPRKKAGRRARRRQMELLRGFHSDLRERDFGRFGPVLASFEQGEGERLSIHEMMHGREAWDMTVERYGALRPEVSFLDYFWTYRFTHLPMFQVLSMEIPRARVYHAVSTGYAGLLGAMARHRYHRPLLLTEHGIYVKERRIEISQARWIYDLKDERLRVKRELGAFQNMWVRLFEALARLTYRSSDLVITLYEGNRAMQIAEGADPKRTLIIPNGINMERFGDLADARNAAMAGSSVGPFVIGFVGRVVPIKDVKTFLRACKVVAGELPGFKALILGPTEEDPQYFRECRDLVDLLRLGGVVEFLGKVNVAEYYAKLDLIVLTSVSEAQPLVILEANCAGIPVVASDVGSCAELLHGRTEADQALGPSGFITRVADPQDTAKGILTILENPETRAAMSRAGKERVRSFYRMADLNRQYRDIYGRYMEQGDSPWPA